MKMKKLCMNCRENYVSNPKHDYCYECFSDLEDDELTCNIEDKFEEELTAGRIYTTYIMFYGKNKNKIGYTKDLNSRIIEIRREYPNNKLVYFREFSKESEARRFEAWLKKLTNRKLIRFIAEFQNKIKKVENL